MSLVLDGSAALAWCFADETTPAVDAVMDQVAEAGAVVPAIWRLEVANGPQAGLRRSRLDAERRDAMLAALADLPIGADPETDRHAWTATLRLADRHALTLYDASYLELALRLGLPMATLDKALRSAADTAGVPLLGH
ncbi:type II toxin-antitoxin system VapC family toxin [Roseitranquillus sediminis]|uniref:type II toxin-antitoxin system VapC family toxin n=1 Tax=Roseitranquillus sediminis TaxID=2809051 RepID=UPI001D0CAC67|nr:type II toxin-antitoxin system VapC family toxin [Roseitranquillus sediminis]MBM9595089.1 type II toxin-antitoxin system VapC family toxin [Roseitranquillus sediminis]